MDESKPWWQSRAIWGALVTLGASAAGLFGVNFEPADLSTVADNAVLIAAGLGAILALVGRIRAKETIRSSPVGRAPAAPDPATALAQARINFAEANAKLARALQTQ